MKNANKTTHEAAGFHNMPWSALKHYVLEREMSLKQINDEKYGFGLSREYILHIVQCYIIQNKLKTRIKSQRPGKDWFQWFRKKNRLTIKLPQIIEHSRCDQTKFDVRFQGTILYVKLGRPVRTYKNSSISSSKMVDADHFIFCWFRNVFLTNVGTDWSEFLVHDEHSIHISAQLVRLAQTNNTEIMKLLPHTTYVL